MLVKCLGLIDFIGGLILILGAGNNLPFGLLIFLGLILLVKSGIGMLKNFASWIDFGASIIYFLLVFFSIPGIICIIIGILLVQKGIFSFL